MYIFISSVRVKVVLDRVPATPSTSHCVTAPKENICARNQQMKMLAFHCGLKRLSISKTRICSRIQGTLGADMTPITCPSSPFALIQWLCLREQVQAPLRHPQFSPAKVGFSCKCSKQVQRRFVTPHFQRSSHQAPLEKTLTVSLRSSLQLDLLEEKTTRS